MNSHLSHIAANLAPGHTWHARDAGDGKRAFSMRYDMQSSETTYSAKYVLAIHDYVDKQLKDIPLVIKRLTALQKKFGMLVGQLNKPIWSDCGFNYVDNMVLLWMIDAIKYIVQKLQKTPNEITPDEKVLLFRLYDDRRGWDKYFKQPTADPQPDGSDWEEKKS